MEDLHITFKQLDDMTGDEIRACKRSTFRDGQMRPRFRDLLPQRRVNAQVILAKDSSGALRGWGLIFRVPAHKTPRLYIHVQTRYRRKGIGRKIVEQAVKNLDCAPRVFGHDKTSVNFYTRFNDTVDLDDYA